MTGLGAQLQHFRPGPACKAAVKDAHQSAGRDASEPFVECFERYAGSCQVGRVSVVGYEFMTRRSMAGEGHDHEIVGPGGGQRVETLVDRLSRSVRVAQQVTTGPNVSANKA